jgi:excisionase family DNA binding protein
MENKHLNNIEDLRLLRAADVAAILKISRAMAYRLMQNGDIPTIHVHNAVRVRASDLEDYIEKNWSGWLPV